MRLRTDRLVPPGFNACSELRMACAFLAVAATVLLFSEKELASKWGVSILEEGGLVQRTAEEERAADEEAEHDTPPPSQRAHK